MSLKALAGWLEHTDPAFCARHASAHLMPSSDERTRAAIATVDDRRIGSDGPRGQTGE